MTEGENRVYLVDDDVEMRTATAQWLELSGCDVQSFADAPTALAELSSTFSGVVVSDIRMPKMDGMTFLTRLYALDSDIPVILLTAHGDVQMAVDAMQKGAYDFIEKPFDPEYLLDIVRRACEKRRLVMENHELRRRLAGVCGIEQRLIGNSPEICRLREEILDVADTDAPVLIQGETGTGKEVVARCLHAFGARREGKYVPVNCGAVPENIFESELFGHERGAFTGADRQRIGRFEYAQGGVLFLDEIGTMPLPLQVKVLRALQEREVIRVGSNEAKPVDIRLISATSKDLLTECSTGTFREDLYYRINVVELRVPPLRERGEDILLLFNYFVSLAAVAYNRPEVSLPSADIGLMMNHDWPGNVRELKNIAERYVLSSIPIGQRLTTVLRSPHQGAINSENTSLQELMRYHERLLLEQALIRHCGDVQAVMTELDLPRRTLNEKMSRHHLDRKNYL
ncbi:two-component system, NtrC family, C4-dicarboxylate transport response regulator DctD [Desulfuromusa kysingii]|uniref:Two-component system, NtrC family, C4-dicarboxylate transport response regulator DctD n=1 Tax=Desulfuromusa kysingii TaxID=37625 RepID=A0A1H3Y3H6_9BACT|nr:sigma-54 dependent transcriptional regulator [Desulfuromusa kysingii]SEA06265.1 two-component system, NtrC family, C4-dicarboxylate transport response regulator DctD [Desulfuromusa kysingii]